MTNKTKKAKGHDERSVGQSELMDGLSCSFCGKGKEFVNHLITGPCVNICDECLLLCTSTLFDALAEKTERLNELAR